MPKQNNDEIKGALKKSKDDILNAARQSSDLIRETKESRHAIAERLRAVRMQHGYSQKEIADLADINPTTYSGYENKISLPHINILIRLADAYQISLDYLVGRSEKYTQSSEKTDDLAKRLAAIEEEIKSIKENK